MNQIMHIRNKFDLFIKVTFLEIKFGSTGIQSLEISGVHSD